jgi:ABC-type multidrug transport system ATPase subunit
VSLRLRIEDLSKTYSNGVRALRDVFLEVPTGMFGLLGPNGAGKSTLMRTLATLQEADSGRVTLDGLDVLRQKEEVRRILGYLPQEFGVYPKVTAEAMLTHVAVLKGLTDRSERKDAVDALFHQVNLWEVRRKKLGTYSGGMRQRFGIAQALLGSPKLLIVDEPTAGLDPEERLRFLNLLAEIGENIVVILSTHIVEDVSELCSEMAIISEGEVLLTGRPGDAVARFHGKVWEKAVPRAELPEVERSRRVISSHLVAGRTVVHVLDEADPGEGFHPVEADLKDVYFATLRGWGGPAAPGADA